MAQNRTNALFSFNRHIEHLKPIDHDSSTVIEVTCSDGDAWDYKTDKNDEKSIRYPLPPSIFVEP